MQSTLQGDSRALRVAITGGTSGLGLALVRNWRARGARIAFVARGTERVERVARETGAAGIVGDVARKEDIYPIAMQILAQLGGLDVLVNNASDLGPVPLALLADTDCEDLERALAANLLGPIRLTKALLGALAASGREGSGAVVLNVSAGAGVATQRIGADTRLRVVDAILSGTHEPGTSHYDQLRAFVDEATLARVDAALVEREYRTHEFGDSVLMHRASAAEGTVTSSKLEAPY